MTTETSAIPAGDTERVERERLIALLDSVISIGSPTWQFELGKVQAMLRADATLRTRLRESEDEARRLREDALAAGIKAAADWVSDRRFEHEKEHGYIEPDTGALSYGSGAHAWAKEEYNCELCEIEDGIRALAAHPAASAQTGEAK